MTDLVELLRVYPLLCIALIVVPLFGGFVGAYLGYDNLTTRLANERQQQRIENRQEAIKQQLDVLQVPVETIRHYEQSLQAQGRGLDVLHRILSQYDQLQRGIAVREQFTGRPDADDRIATSEHILNELRVLLGNTQTVPGPGGQALIIKTAPNTFRVTFAVPMRVPPTLAFSRLPNGVEPHVIEKSKIGFVVVFTPLDVAVNGFGFEASAEL